MKPPLDGIVTVGSIKLDNLQYSNILVGHYNLRILGVTGGGAVVVVTLQSKKLVDPVFSVV